MLFNAVQSLRDREHPAEAVHPAVGGDDLHELQLPDPVGRGEVRRRGRVAGPAGRPARDGRTGRWQGQAAVSADRMNTSRHHVPRTRLPLSDLRAQRIALIKPSALGDVVHALPVLGALRHKFPDARIAWVINRSYQQLIDGHRALDETIPFDRSALKGGWRKAAARLPVAGPRAAQAAFRPGR